MIVLGIDPGLAKCGMAVVDMSHRRPECQYIETERTHTSLPLNVRLERIGASFWLASRGLVFARRDGTRVLVAIENQEGAQVAQFKRGQSSHSAKRVNEVVGHLKGQCSAYGFEVLMVEPNAAKKAIGAPRGADKKTVKRWVSRICDGLPKRWSQDAADAVAVAIAGARMVRR